MRRSSFSDNEILAFVRELEAGRPATEIASVADVSVRTLHRWRRRYGGLKPFAIQALRRLEQENRRLRSAAERQAEASSPSADVHAQPVIVRSDFGGAAAADRSTSVVVGRFASLRLR
jgi:putative transposase